MTAAEPESSVRELLRRAVAAGWTPGGVAAWRVGERAGTVAFGRAVLVDGRPARDATTSTVYDLASLTKPLATATLLLLARREGRIDLDAPLSEVLEESRGRPVGRATVGQLSSHSAGLAAWAPLYALASSTSRDAVLGALLDLGLERPPGDGVTYSCPGYLLLGLAVERVLGETLDAAFRRRVARPLGVEEEIGYRPAADDDRLAGGAASPSAERRLLAERGLGDARIPTVARHLPDDGNARALGGVAGNAGLFGSARGVLEVARQYLPKGGAGAGPLLTADEVATATRSRTPGLEQERALGWQLASTPGCSAGPALSARAIGHTGFTGTSVWIDPRNGSAVVLLTNRHHPAHREIDLHPLRRRFHRLVVTT